MEDNTKETEDSNTNEVSENVIEIANEKTATETTASANESEYETLDEAYSSSEHEEEKERVPVDKVRETGSESGEHSGTESDNSLALERQEGDGQESTPNRKVDDDEDKRNPQYIPKRGTFYEHDDRTAVEESEAVEEPVETERQEKENKKKVWQEKESSKWNHDRFNDSEQAPKSRSELIAIYGYDIRNEEGPPRARRRRRYGRGPNKYTRNWEDEDAYNKPVVTPPVRKPKKKSGSEEFPPLVPEAGSSSNSVEIEEEIIDTSPTVQTASDNRSKPEPKPIIKVEQAQFKVQQTVEASENQIKRNFNKSHQPNPPQQHSQKERIIGKSRPPKTYPENMNESQSETKGFTKSFQFRDKGVPKSSSNRKSKEIINSQNYTNKNLGQHHKVHEMDKEMARMTIQEGAPYKSNKYNSQRQASVPPRMQAEQKTSKRYSSLRQRSLPETTAPPFNQHSNYYPNEYSPTNAPNQQQPGILQHPAAQLHPQIPQNAPQIPLQNNPPPIPSIPHQGPSTATALMQAPPQFAPPFPQPPAAFLQPGVAPPPFMPQQPPQMINYAQPQFTQPPFTGYQHQPQFTTPPQPELYQPQGGITYYSTQNQQVVQRAPLKRPKAAIPIVPPPPQENRNKGRPEDASSEGYSNDGAGNYEGANVVIQQ